MRCLSISGWSGSHQGFDPCVNSEVTDIFFPSAFFSLLCLIVINSLDFSNPEAMQCKFFDQESYRLKCVASLAH